jgi:hypothetical protein
VTTFSTSLINHTVLPSQTSDSSHRVLEAKCPPRPTHLTLLHRAHSTDHPLSRDWPGGILFVSWPLTCHLSTKGSARILAPPPLRLQKHTTYAHSPHLWHYFRLANCSYAWGRRLCGMTPNIHRKINVYYNKSMVLDEVTLLPVSLVIATLHNNAHCSVTKLLLLRPNEV